MSERETPGSELPRNPIFAEIFADIGRYQQARRAGASAEDRALFDAQEAIDDPGALDLADEIAMRIANEELAAMRAERLPRAS